MSLIIIERGHARLERGRNLDKLGLHSQDTAALCQFTRRLLSRAVRRTLLGESSGSRCPLPRCREAESCRGCGPLEGRAAALDDDQRHPPRRSSGSLPVLTAVITRSA